MTIQAQKPNPKDISGIPGYTLKYDIQATSTAIAGQRPEIVFSGSGAYAIRMTKEAKAEWLKRKKRVVADFLINLPHLADTAIYDLTKARIARGYGNHEAGHARYTDWDALGKYLSLASKHDPDAKKSEKIAGVYKVISNIIEDCFMEKRVMQDFPGARLNLNATRVHVTERSRDSIAENGLPDVFIPNFLEALLQTCNTINRWDSSPISMQIIKEIGEKYPPAVEICERWRTQIADLKTSYDSHALSFNVTLDLLKTIEENTPPSQSGDDDPQDDSKPSDNSDSSNGGGNGQSGSDEPDQQPSVPQDLSPDSGDQAPSPRPQKKPNPEDRDQARSHAADQDAADTPANPSDGDGQTSQQEPETQSLKSETHTQSGPTSDSPPETSDSDEQTSSVAPEACENEPEGSGENSQNQDISDELADEEGSDDSADQNEPGQNASGDRPAKDDADGEDGKTVESDPGQGAAPINATTPGQSGAAGQPGAGGKGQAQAPDPMPNGLDEALGQVSDADLADFDPLDISDVFDQIAQATEKALKDIEKKFGKGAGPTAIEGVNEIVHRPRPGMPVPRRSAADPRTTRALRTLIRSHKRERINNRREEGDFDHANILSQAVGDPDVYKQTIRKVTPNTALAVLGDQSLSMDEILETVGAILASTAEASLGMPNLKTALYTYTSGGRKLSFHILKDFKDQMLAGRIALNAWRADPGDLGSTPTAQAMLETGRRLDQCREPRKIMILITDGDPDDKIAAAAAHDLLKRRGIITCLIEIGSGVDIKLPFDIAEKVADIDELPPKLLEIARKAIQPQARRIG